MGDGVVRPEERDDRLFRRARRAGARPRLFTSSKSLAYAALSGPAARRPEVIRRRHRKRGQHRQPGRHRRQACLGPPLAHARVAGIRHAAVREPVRAAFRQQPFATNCPSRPRRSTAAVGRRWPRWTRHAAVRDRPPVPAGALQDDVGRLHRRGPSRGAARRRGCHKIRRVATIDAIDRIETAA